MATTPSAVETARMFGQDDLVALFEGLRELAAAAG
jgi:hypothetical protein